MDIDPSFDSSWIGAFCWADTEVAASAKIPTAAPIDAGKRMPVFFVYRFIIRIFLVNSTTLHGSANVEEMWQIVYNLSKS
jgi:hypothetical protein